MKLQFGTFFFSVSDFPSSLMMPQSASPVKPDVSYDATKLHTKVCILIICSVYLLASRSEKVAPESVILRSGSKRKSHHTCHVDATAPVAKRLQICTSGDDMGSTGSDASTSKANVRRGACTEDDISNQENIPPPDDKSQTAVGSRSRRRKRKRARAMRDITKGETSSARRAAPRRQPNVSQSCGRVSSGCRGRWDTSTGARYLGRISWLSWMRLP